MLLQGRVAMVTGGGRGNGAAIAKGLARQGARIVVTDIDPATASETAQSIKESGGEAWSYRLDVGNIDECRALAPRIEQTSGPVSILVNNAGITRRASLEDPALRAAWDECMNVNSGGALNVSVSFLPQLRQTKGTIVNIASIVAYVATEAFVGYSASKAALVAMTRSLAKQFAADNIRVNAIAPGFFETPMTEAVKNDPARYDFYSSRTPLGRWGMPDELVGPVVFLASDMSSFVTGTTLVVDGGMTIG